MCSFLLNLILFFICMTGVSLIRADEATATPLPDAFSENPCLMTPETVVTEQVTPETVQTAEAGETPEVTPEATVSGEQNPDAALHFNTFLPTDISFNPSTDQPVVIIMIFSLVFRNQLNQSIQVNSPKFELAIDGVPWGEVASTDFQTGQLLANATQGIVLQSLTFVSKTSPEQQQVLDCIRQQYPVSLTLTGTIQTTVDGEDQPVEVELTSPDVVIQPRKPQS